MTAPGLFQSHPPQIPIRQFPNRTLWSCQALVLEPLPKFKDLSKKPSTDIQIYCTSNPWHFKGITSNKLEINVLQITRRMEWMIHCVIPPSDSARFECCRVEVSPCESWRAGKWEANVETSCWVTLPQEAFRATKAICPKNPRTCTITFQLQKLILQEVRESYGPQTSLIFFFHGAFSAITAELNEL